MSANVETMFYVREVPWHGLGTKVQEAPTSKDALELAGLNWTVDGLPVFDARGNEIKGYKANTRSSDGSVLGIVSGKYTIIQNAEAFDFTDSLIGGEVRYETAGSLRGGRQVWLLAQMPKRTVAGDAVDPFLCFTNTFDGSGAVRVCMTPVRVVCNNTLNLALRQAKRAWSARHMGNIQAKLDEARMTLELADEYMTALDDEAAILAGEKMSEAQTMEAIKKLFPVDEKASDRIQNTAKEQQKQLISCVFAPDLEKFLWTKWGFLNAVADYAGHAEPHRHTKTFEERRWADIMGGASVLDKALALVRG